MQDALKPARRYAATVVLLSLLTACGAVVYLGVCQLLGLNFLGVLRRRPSVSP